MLERESRIRAIGKRCARSRTLKRSLRWDSAAAQRTYPAADPFRLQEAGDEDFRFWSRAYELRRRCNARRVRGIATADRRASVATGTGDSLPFHKTFKYTGSAQSFTVPAHVTLLTIVALGAAGGGDTNLGCAHTGRGGRVHAVISVTPGERLTIYVGGQGSTSGGGYNGGAAGAGSGVTISNGGGGASDVRVSPGGLHDRIVVAGGGGGTAGYANTFKGDTYYHDGCGGNGGGLVGGHGYGYYDSYFGGGGGGGKQHHGGAGGSGGEGLKSYPNGQPGSPGVLGDGGVGGAGGVYTDGGAAGGGGGGGYYGAGGGGSSYVESRAKSAHFWQGWKKIGTANGLVVFSWQ